MGPKRIVFVSLAFTLAAILTFFVYDGNLPTQTFDQILMSNANFSNKIGFPTECKKYVSLEALLPEVSIENKTIIVVTVNAAWGPMMDLFLSRLARNPETAHLTNHMLFISFDLEGYDFCCSLSLNCYLDNQNDDSEIFHGNKRYMTPGYLKMMWRRIEILRDMLKLGYDLIHSDVDVIWLQNPIPWLEASAGNFDMLYACDLWSPDPNAVSVNGGFFYARSNERTATFFDYWIEQHYSRFQEVHDQEAFGHLRPEMDSHTRSEINLTVKYLETSIIGGVCQLPATLHQLITMHPTCCIGMHKKIAMLDRILHDYDYVMKLPREIREKITERGFTWNKPITC